MKKLINRLVRIDALALVACVALFLWFPYLDLQVSHWFYDKAKGGFWLNGIMAGYIYDGTNIVSRTIIVLLSMYLLASYVLKAAQLKKHRKCAAFLLICGLLGPVIVTDTLLKTHMDRPRPVQTQEFGGPHPFQAPFIPGLHCKTCKSFVSGHAAAGFYFLSIMFLCQHGSISRKLWLGVGLSMGTLVGVVRILQGGHYLSDVIFSGFVVWFSSLLVYQLMYGVRGNYLKQR